MSGWTTEGQTETGPLLLPSSSSSSRDQLTSLPLPHRGCRLFSVSSGSAVLDLMPGFQFSGLQDQGPSQGPSQGSAQGSPQGPQVLVTGATGLLGRAVCREFQSGGWTVTGTGYRRARPRFLRCDLTDEDAVRRLLHEHKPDVIVHCAAERRPDVMERHSDAAVSLNVHATSTVSKEAAACGALLLYISTDYVFDGRNPPYGEDDHPNPLNLYGRSKLEGERETLRLCPGAVILRVPVLFGEVEFVMESAVTSLWQNVQEATEDNQALDHCLQRFPTDARDVAAVCRNLAERGRQDPSVRGIFHFSGKEQMTKYEMAVAMAQAFNLPSNHLIPLTEQPAASAPRPINSQLDCSRLEQLDLSVEPRAFSAAIAECLWPFTADKRWRQTIFH